MKLGSRSTRKPWLWALAAVLLIGFGAGATAWVLHDTARTGTPGNDCAVVENLAGEWVTMTQQVKTALAKVQQLEQSWGKEFAQTLIEKRKDVDSGNATVAELQIYYLQKDASSWVKNSTDALDGAEVESRKSDETAANGTFIISLLSTLMALCVGVIIAFRTARSITGSRRAITLRPSRNLPKSAARSAAEAYRWRGSRRRHSSTIWSRSRESSLSIDDHRREVKSFSTGSTPWRAVSAWCTAAAGRSGTKP